MWESLVADGVSRYGHRVHAYCWMTNHAHIAVQASTDPLGPFISVLASSYARRVNRRLGRTGHLFERRYRAMLVQEDSYLLELVRYIHRNPVQAGIADSPSLYRWSSHRAYSTGVGPEWLTLKFVLNMFASDSSAARQRYIEFIHESSDQDMLSAFNETGDAQRLVLGDDEWQQETTEIACVPAQTESLAELVRRNCAQFSVAEAELRSPSRERRVSAVRAKIAWEATEAQAASVSEIARLFGRTQPAISQLICRWRARNKL